MDGFNEKGREVPGVGKGRSKSACMLEIRVQRRRFLKAVQVLEGSRVSRDVFFVRGFQ